jgi:phage terminase large subunit
MMMPSQRNMIVKLSDYVRLRPQQRPLFDAYFNRRIRNIIHIAHRRFGKGLGAFMLTCAAAIYRRGVYGYFLPTIGQSRRVIWQTIGSDGIKLIDRFPSSLVASINHSEQIINFANGSILYVSGSDNYKRLIGMDFCHIVWDEYQDSNPAAVDAFRPMITRNKGFQAFLGTPRAYNHFKDLYQEHVDDPEWYVTNLTINDTFDEFGQSIITEEDIEAERRAGMPEELILQEYYGSWDAAVRGAYYSKQLNDARAQKRIGNFPFNPNYPVYTSSDWGYDDATAIWFFQHYNESLFMIDYYENREQGLEHYVRVLKQKQAEWRCRYAIHWAPHDIENRELIAGKSRKDAAREMGILFRTVAAPAKKIHGIHCVRYIFPRLFFNEKSCRIGLKHLTEYRSDFDEKHNVYSLQPLRNAATHGADALQTLALGWLKAFEEGNMKRQFEIANLYGTLIW